MVTHDREMVDKMRRRVIALEDGRLARDERREATRANEVKLLFSESFRSLGAGLSTTIAATMTVLIGMFLLGLFIALGSWAQAFGDKQKEKLLVKVYFCTESTCAKPATEQQINAVRLKLNRIRSSRKSPGSPRPRRSTGCASCSPTSSRTCPATRSRTFEVAAHDGANVKAISRTCARRLPRRGREDQRRRGGVRPRRHRRARALDCVRGRDGRPADLVGAADREHDPALDLLAAS